MRVVVLAIGMGVAFSMGGYVSTQVYNSSDTETKYVYDDNGRVTNINYKDGSTIEYTYDDSGNIIDIKYVEGEIVDNGTATDDTTSENNDAEKSKDTIEESSKADSNGNDNEEDKRANKTDKDNDVKASKNTEEEIVGDTQDIEEMEEDTEESKDNKKEVGKKDKKISKGLWVWICSGISVLILIIIIGLYMTRRKNNKDGEDIQDENNTED